VSIDVDGLKARTDIVSVVSHYVPTLKKRGAEYLGRCVAHNDNNPSMWVSPSKGFVHCFSCGWSADAIDFVMHVEGLDFKAACERLGAADTWAPAKPIPHERTEPVPERITSKPPADAPAPSMKIRALGDPSRVWCYRDTDGGTLGYVARYETPEGKQIRCWSWGRRGDGDPAWGCGHWTKPRPLYGLDRLAARPDAPVLAVEGEKAADAAQALLPSYVAVAWPGGSQSWHKAGWEPLRGRQVLLWPDNDAPGIECMDKLAALLADPKGLACIVRVIDPNRMPDGFDAADWTGSTDELIAWAKPRARDYLPPAPQDTRKEAGLDTDEAPPADAGPIPIEAYADEPRAQPSKPRRPRLATVNGNAALAPEPDAEAMPAAMSEDMLADHFASVHAAHWRYVKPWNSWFQWRTDGWYRDDTGMVDRLAVEVTRQALYWPDAGRLTPDARRRVNSKRTAGNLRDISMTDRRIAATVDQWDTDPMLLGVPGGVVDLERGKLLPANPEHYITKRTSVAPEPGECPHWLALLDRVTQGEAGMLEYLQRLCGYVLTGETREECFAFIYGPAQTGKSTFIRVLAEIMGEYHRKAQMETFTESRQERHAEELAVLHGARLVTCTETEEGKRWNESRIKALTGRDRIRARFMRENSFEFDPQFKLLIAGNHAPHLRNVDEAMKRRLHIIPFTQPLSMEERDDRLADKLREEYPQILHWMVQGALSWNAAKLGRPEQIAQAVNQYLETEDTLGEWLAEAVDRDEHAKCLSGGAYSNFKRWAEAAGEFVMSQKRFVQALKERGFDTKRVSGKRYISGLELKATEPPFEGYNVP
jgi:putative DNA primase/helicase